MIKLRQGKVLSFDIGKGRGSDPIELPVPLHEPGNAFLDRSGGRESDVAHEVVDVGISGGDVAGLKGKQCLVRFLANGLLQDFDKMQQLDRPVIADVVHARGS